MRTLVHLAIITTSLAAAATIAPPTTYPTEPDEAVALYEFAKESLGATPLADRAPNPNPAKYVGRAIEVQATFSGRIAVNAQDASERRVLVRLQLSDSASLYVVSSSEVTGLQQGEQVRAILDVPGDDPEHASFRLRAIVREYDLPRDPRPSSKAPAPQTGQSQSPLTVPAPQTPTAGNPRQGAALPPEYRERASSSVPTIVPFTAPVIGAPREGKQGAWDPVGSGYPVVDESRLSVWRAWIKKRNSKLTDQQADWISRWVIYYSAINGVDHRLMFAMIHCESTFNPFCVSHAGATGLTQLMPCNVTDFKVRNKWNVQEQIRAGVEHFKEMLDMWEGRDNYEQFALAAASYNAGPNRVKRCGGRIPDIKETRNYVRKLGDLFYKLWREGYP